MSNGITGMPDRTAASYCVISYRSGSDAADADPSMENNGWVSCAADADPASILPKRSPPDPCPPNRGIWSGDCGILSAADGGASQLVFSMVSVAIAAGAFLDMVRMKHFDRNFVFRSVDRFIVQCKSSFMRVSLASALTRMIENFQGASKARGH